MKKILLGILLGFSLKFFGIEMAQIISEVRWNNCIHKMHTGEYPMHTEDGQHYCLATNWSNKQRTVIENIMLFQLDLWQKFKEN